MPARQTSSEGVTRNKEVFLRFQEEVFNQADWRIETLAKYLRTDFIDHSASPGDPPGLDGVQRRFSERQAAFSQAREVNLEIIGEADLVAVLYRVHARHTGEYMGIAPTHRQVSIPGIKILRFEDGLMAEHWSIYDYLTTASEIGAEIVFTPRTPSRFTPVVGRPSASSSGLPGTRTGWHSRE